MPAITLAIATLAVTGCKSNQPEPAGTAPEPAAEEAPGEEPEAQATTEQGDQLMTAKREALVDELASKGIEDERVLSALRAVPRHELVPGELQALAYADRPLPIGEDQTISQPYIVALMSQLADIQPEEKVLEVGTGSGYQGAVLGKLADAVYTIEIIEPLGKRAERDLKRLGLADNIHFRIGDGYAGWPSEAPFDAIIVTAAPPAIPEPLKEQLKVGGKMVIPVGEERQELMLLEKTEEGLEEREVIPVRFVPMTGKAQQ